MATERLLIHVDEKGALVVSRNIDSIGASAQRAGSSVQLLRKALGLMGGLVAAMGIVAGVKQLASFGQTMSTVQAITSATTEEFKGMRDLAKELGEQTRFSATQAGEGMLFLARAGFKADKVIATVADTLRLAQAGGMDLGRAADIASNILTAFRGNAEELTRVVDVLALTANSSNTNIEQLGMAMKFAAPFARGLGVSLEATAAAAGVLSDAGMQAFLAGTGIRTVLQRLEGPMKNQLKILRALGVRAEEVRPSHVGLAAAVERLRDAGMGAAQAMRFFSTRGGGAMNVLMASVPKLKAMEERLDDAGGTAKRVAIIMDDNLNGAMLRTKSALQSVVLEIGDLGADDSLTRMFNGLAGVLRLVARNIDKVVAGLKIGIIVWAVYSTSVHSAVAATAKFMVTSGGIFTLMVAGVAILTLFSDKIHLTAGGYATLADVGTSAMERLNEATENALGFWSELWGKAFGTTTVGWSELSNDSERSLLTVLGAVTMTLDQIVGVVTGIIGVIVFEFATLPETIGNAFTLALRFAAKKIADFLNWTLSGINTLREKVGMSPIDVEFKGMTVDPGKVQQHAKDIVDIFMTSFENTGLTDMLTDVFAGAEEEAAERALSKGIIAAIARKDAAAQKKESGMIGGVVIEKEALTTFQEIEAALKQEASLLALGNSERERKTRLLQMERDIIKKGGMDLTADEKVALDLMLQGNAALDLRASLLEEIKGPIDSYNKSLVELVALEQAGEISTAEMNAKIKSLKASLGEMATSKDLLQLEDILATPFESATDAITEFTETGKFAIMDFVSDVLSQWARLSAMKMFKNFGSFGGFDIGGFATGGSFTVGGAGGADSQPVAFMATPGETVSIRTPGQQAAMRSTSVPSVAVPVVNVKVINVLDPNEITDAMNSSEGEETIINVISRNSTIVKQALA